MARHAKSRLRAPVGVLEVRPKVEEPLSAPELHMHFHVLPCRVVTQPRAPYCRLRLLLRHTAVEDGCDSCGERLPGVMARLWLVRHGKDAVLRCRDTELLRVAALCLPCQLLLLSLLHLSCSTAFPANYGEGATFHTARSLHNSPLLPDILVAGSEADCGRRPGGTYAVEPGVAARSPYSMHASKSHINFSCSVLLALAAEGEHGFARGRVKLAENATAWHDVGVSWFSSGGLVSNTGRCLFAAPRAEHPTPPPPGRAVRAVGEALLCAKNSGTSFHHVMYDNLLGCATAFDLLLSRPDMMVIMDAVTSTNSAAYALFGVARARLLSLRDASYTVNRLYVPSYTGCGTMSYANMQAFQRAAYTTHPQLYAATPTSILIVDRMRDGSCDRCLRNHVELVAALRMAFPGREVIQYRLHNMTETIALFARTRLVIAPHGAAMSNMPLLPRCAAVIEIHNRAELNYCFLDMCVGLGFSYRGMQPEGAERANVSSVLAAAKSLYEAPCVE